MDMGPENLRKSLYGVFGLTAMFSAFMFAGTGYFWVLGGVLLVLLARTIYLIHISESFVAVFTHYHVGFVVSFSIMISGCLYLVARSDYEQSFIDSISLALVPVLLFTVEVLFFYFTRPPKGKAGYEVRGNRVVVIDQPFSHFAGNLLASIVLVSGIAMMMAWQLSEMAFVVYVLTLLTLYLIYIRRHWFRVLKTIRVKEKRASELTFENIDEIREARRRWWMSRLLNWLISLSKASRR
ncbi:MULTISPECIES: hypothetical protein [Pseudomonas]|uniref:hypothetical protein n=1 Tax=Pseudomonas TaxID=286 RepID=UPI000C078C5A|nr:MULTISPECIES: hypothetical protein [Pseudomonas]MCD5978426.1 hypothetical protein [Pseudomonas quasicaspiana]PHN17120.1 hypothetical protein AO242_20670 [Pseudomonas sp. ICMP 561]